MSKISIKRPNQLWMLAFNDGETKGFVRAVDDPPYGDAYLCATSWNDIQALAKHQKEVYEIDCVPIRVY